MFFFVSGKNFLGEKSDSGSLLLHLIVKDRRRINCKMEQNVKFVACATTLMSGVGKMKYSFDVDPFHRLSRRSAPCALCTPQQPWQLAHAPLKKVLCFLRASTKTDLKMNTRKKCSLFPKESGETTMETGCSFSNRSTVNQRSTTRRNQDARQGKMATVNQLL